MSKKSAKFTGKIEPFFDNKPFYMVVVEDSIYPPKEKHEKYEDAFQEMLRLSKKENKKAFVLQSITQVEQIPIIKQFDKS
jgi:phosphoribosyl 1,2-cyclic phosphodiesterase